MYWHVVFVQKCEKTSPNLPVYLTRQTEPIFKRQVGSTSKITPLLFKTMYQKLATQNPIQEKDTLSYFVSSAYLGLSGGWTLHVSLTWINAWHC